MTECFLCTDVIVNIFQCSLQENTHPISDGNASLPFVRLFGISYKNRSDIALNIVQFIDQWTPTCSKKTKKTRLVSLFHSFENHWKNGRLFVVVTPCLFSSRREASVGDFYQSMRQIQVARCWSEHWKCTDSDRWRTGSRCSSQSIEKCRLVHLRSYTMVKRFYQTESTSIPWILPCPYCISTSLCFISIVTEDRETGCRTTVVETRSIPLVICIRYGRWRLFEKSAFPRSEDCRMIVSFFASSMRWM